MYLDAMRSMGRSKGSVGTGRKKPRKEKETCTAKPYMLYKACELHIINKGNQGKLTRSGTVKLPVSLTIIMTIVVADSF